MKKIIAIILSFVCIFSLAIPAFASELSETDSTATSTMTYNVPGGYTIVIPETIDMNFGFSLEASYLNLASDKQVNVYLDSIVNDYITFTNESGDTIDVHITGHDADNRVAVFSNMQNCDYFIEGYLDEAEANTAKSGKYTATVEFTVSMGERDPIE